MIKSTLVGLALVATVGTGVSRSATSLQPHGAAAVLATEPVALPPFADLPGSRRSVSQHEYERARSDSRFEMLRLTYLSDGLRVIAFVYKPSAPPNKLPVIVYNRGSYVRQNAASELVTTFHRLGEAGFAVVAPMYRGSEGARGRDEMGGADLRDLMQIQPVVASLPYADAATSFLYGESRGGMMTLQALRDGFPVRAAAIVGVFTDLEQYLKEDPRAAVLAPQIWPDYEANQAAIVERRSAVRWADRINAPLLIMHGGADRTVSPGHALQLAAALQRGGKTYELVIAAGAGHMLQPFEAERDHQVVRWFRRHLREQP